MPIDHGTHLRQSYRTTAKDQACLEGDLRQQRQRSAATLASLVVDVQQGRRRMNSRLLDEVRSAAGRLAEIDEALWAVKTPENGGGVVE